MAVGEKAACCPCRRWRCPGPHLDRWQISSDQGQRDSRRMEEVPWGKLFDLDPGGRKLGHLEQKQEEGILECSGPSTDEETTDVACSGVRGAASGCVGAPEEWRFCGKSCRWRSLWRGRQRLACRGRLGSALEADFCLAACSGPSWGPRWLSASPARSKHAIQRAGFLPHAAWEANLACVTWLSSSFLLGSGGRVRSHVQPSFPLRGAPLESCADSGRLSCSRP